MNDMDSNQDLDREQLKQLFDASSNVDDAVDRSARYAILSSLDDIDWRYSEISDLAVGGMKKVSLVTDLHTQRRVVYAEPLDSASNLDVERFFYEARITAFLEHPNIVPIHDMGLNPDGKPYFTMKLIAGSSLNSILRKVHGGDENVARQYDLDSLLDILIKVCDAVAYAHSKEVLHLDIKSGNVQVGRFGEVQLCDWGLAKFVGDDIDTFKGLVSEVSEGATISGRLKGTPGFMAPELCREPWTATVATEIYALGALLYEILTGLPPVEGQGVNELLERTRMGQVIPPKKRCKDKLIPEGLAAVALKALSLRPEDRYASVTDFQQELIRYMRGFSTIAEEAGILKGLQLLYRRNPVRFNIFFGAVAVVMALTVAFIVKVRHEKQTATRARDEAVQNLQMFIQEQQRRELLEHETQGLIDQVRGLADYSSAERLIGVLNQVLERTSDPKERNVLIAKKGLMHFVLEEFNAAQDCYKQITYADMKTIGLDKNMTDFLVRVWRDFAELKPDDNEPLSEEQFLLLSNRFQEGKANLLVELLCYTYYHHRRRYPCDSPPECLKTVISMLDRVNYYGAYGVRHIDENTLTPFGDGYKLDLSGHPYKTFRLPISGIARESTNILLPLQLRSLDLSDSMFTDFSNLSDIRLDELIVLGIRLPDRWWELRLNKLTVKKFVVDQDCPKSLVEGLREHGIAVEIRNHVRAGR